MSWWLGVGAAGAVLLAVLVLGRLGRFPAIAGAPRAGYGVAVATTVLLLVGSAWGLARDNFGDMSCPRTEGSSDYGRHGWSVVPPGPTCTFDDDATGPAEVRGPTPVMSIWLVVLAAGTGTSVALLRRRSRPPAPPATAPTAPSAPRQQPA